VGWGKKAKKQRSKKNKKYKYCHLEGSLQAATKQNNTEQKKTNKQVGSLLTGPESIFTAASERILIP